MDIIKQHERLIREATECLNRINQDLDSIHKDDYPDESDPNSELELLRTLQLVLQFRLDSQDALQHLFEFSQSLWQVLGVSKQNSSSTNIERLAFALGGEDLHHALSILSRLIDALLRVLQRYNLGKTAQNRAFGIANRKQIEAHQVTEPSRLYVKMVRVLDVQKSFNLLLEQLENSLEDAIAGQPHHPGPILDYIGKLEGPISHFHQAVLHGLIAAGGLYQQMEARTHFNLKLDELLHKANQTLEQTHHIVEAPKLFQPIKTISTSQELEARAAEKRFGYFFPHP